MVTIDGDVMWVGSGSRRNGHLLFSYASLDSPAKNPTAKKYSMTFKFSQVTCLSFSLISKVNHSVFLKCVHHSSFFHPA